MKRISTLLCFLFLLNIYGYSQFHYIITSVPDSATILMNGKVIGHTPYRIKFFWKKSKNENNKIVFEVKSPGYKTWSDTLKSKPSKFDFRQQLQLNRDYPKFDLDSSKVVVGFDKLIASFEDGTVIGKAHNEDGTIDSIKWDGSVKVGDKEFERKFYQTISKAGFRTPFSLKDQLFTGDEDQQAALPRFVVGVRLKEYAVNTYWDKNKNYGSGSIKGTTYMKLVWKVMDKKYDKIVTTYTTQDTSHFRVYPYEQVDIESVFTSGLIDFLKNSNLHKLVKNAKEFTSATVDTTSGKNKYTIKRPAISKFADRSAMIKYTKNACVTIITDGGFGSGVIISPDGYILTAYHVVNGVNKIQAKFSNGLKLNAKIIAFDKENDVALLDIDGSGFTALPLGNSDSIEIGENAITIGTPESLNLGQSVTSGIISGKRMLDNKRVYIQTDIAVSPGNSGGPILDSKGEVIGIVQSKIEDKAVEGIGFAIPINRAKKVLGITEK